MARSPDFAEYVRGVVGNLSQRQLAARMDVSQGTVGNMFMGQIPSDEILDRFADATAQERGAVRRRVKVYRAASEMRRVLSFLPDEAVDDIVRAMQDAEREQEEAAG